MERILRLPEVQKKVGLKRAAIYKKIQKGEFPPPIKLGIRASGWKESELEKWISERSP